MLRLLANETLCNPGLQKAMETVLCEMGIKLIESKKQMTLPQRLKKSRLGRTEYLKLYRDHSKLLDAMEAVSSDEQHVRNWIAKNRQIWEKLVQLLALACSEDKITADFWKEEALDFGKMFLECYRDTDVTPYLHIFIYHVGYFREKYGSLEALANYGIEGLHARNKKDIRGATNGFGLFGQKNSVASQLLRRTYRIERARSTKLHDKPARRRKVNNDEVSFLDKRIPLVQKYQQQL